MNGVTTAIVEDTNDPEGLGRVRVRLDGPGRASSVWARVVSPVTSASVGQPRLAAGDEVLVAQPSGNKQDPYLLGTLTPPDSTPQDGPIEIVDATGNNSVVIDPASNTVTVTGSQTVILRGAKVRIEADDIDLRAASKISLDATVIEIDAAASLKATSGGTVTVQGSLVNIN